MLAMVRYKNRYLLLEWKFSSTEIGQRILKGDTPKILLNFFKEKVQAYHGDYGMACVQNSLSVKYHNVSTLISIVRCPRAQHRAVWSALCGVTSYKKEPCSLSLLHLAGTIRSAQKVLVKHNTALIMEELSHTKHKKEEMERKLREILRRDLLHISV